VAVLSVAALAAGCYYVATRRKNYKADKRITDEEEDVPATKTKISSPEIALEEKTEAVDDSRRKETESLLEWIDRQLDEAEKRKKMREEK